MGQVLLVRHGQASFGAVDYDALSPVGFEQARVLGTSLAQRGVTVDRIITGTMRRHRETAETCAEAAGWRGIEAEVEPGWDEFDFLSVLEAHPAPHGGGEPSRAEFQRWFELATEQWVAGAELGYAETFVEFTGRVSAALARVVALSESGKTVVFTSGGPLAWAVSTLLLDGGSAEVWKRLNRVAVNSAVTRLITSPRGSNLLTYNDQAHLEGVPDLLTYR